MKRRLIIFAKEPTAGMVKTRLAGRLSPSRRVDLYKAFLMDTIELAKRVRCGEKIISYESRGQEPVYIKKIAIRNFKFFRQTGRNLGERMHNVFKSAAKNGRCKTVIIGSDSPTLPTRFIENAFSRLSKSSVVLGPSRDGGYYLIGLKRPCPAIFRGIRWGSDTVMEDTVRRAKACGTKVSLMEKWYDVDSAEALAYLESDLKSKKIKGARWTRRFLKIS